VGQKLAELSLGRQVIGITPFSQGATPAHHHHPIWKEEKNQSTVSHIQEITTTARQCEFTRMHGGQAKG
jgi:DNA repair ATPase RecN